MFATTLMSRRVACGFLILCCVVSFSAAQPSIELLHVTKSQHPYIDVEVDPIPVITREQTFLVDDHGVRAPAVRIERRSVPIDIVLVVSSALAWIRKDVVEQDKRTVSGLELVHGLLASEAWRGNVPAGSTITIITYASKAIVAVPPTQLAALPAQPLGAPENYNDVSASVAEGVRLGIDPLKSLTARRRLLVVIGDGVASDHDRDTALLRKHVVDAASASIAIRALVYETWATKDDPKAITSFIAQPTAVDGIQGAVIAMREAVDRVVDGYSVGFDASNFDWDGETHMLTFEGDEVRLQHIPVHLREHGQPSRLSWWRWPLLVIALGTLVVLIRGLRR